MPAPRSQVRRSIGRTWSMSPSERFFIWPMLVTCTYSWRTAGQSFLFIRIPDVLPSSQQLVFRTALSYCAPDKQPTIHTKIDVAYDTVAITITDNGIGISEKCLSHVFNMFYRASERSSGAGLGLYITKETVKKLGGEVTIQSIENRGTVVTVILPNNHRSNSVEETITE